MTKLTEEVGFGTITTNTETDEFTCRGWCTLTAHKDSGTGTWTWQFMGPDKVWRTVLIGSDFITEAVFTASNMVNVFFGTEVKVRGSASSGSTPVWDWQIMSNLQNRGKG